MNAIRRLMTSLAGLALMISLLCQMGCDEHGVRTGFVDVQKVFENSSRGKQQTAAFQEELGLRSGEVKRLNEQVEALKSELQTLVDGGQKYVAQTKLPAFQKAQKELVEAQQQANLELRKSQAEIDKTFMGQLRPVLDALRKEEHLDVIMAIDPNKTLSFDPTLDLTQKALIHYNEAYPLKDDDAMAADQTTPSPSEKSSEDSENPIPASDRNP